jgi:transcriptional regulator with PAS, ATPase and Fis domain
MTPQAQPRVEVAPSRQRLELMLQNGPELIDAVRKFIEKFQLPFTIELSDGTALYNDKTVPKDFGYLKDTLSVGELHLQKFITIDPETIVMKDHARLMARTPYEVLIVGETGTGKEIIAKSMIAERKGVIKAVNCAGFPEALIEAELFGYVRGAFTGAESTRNGLMTEAADGVMFLDEIGELPLVMQAKLLRAIQEKKIRKVGANKDEDINCKFVFATNRNLKDMVKAGTFRRDLYARISTLVLSIKPLKDRRCDCVPIIKSLPGGEVFLKKHKEDIEQGLLDISMNVRSLQQHVIRFIVLGTISIPNQ